MIKYIDNEHCKVSRPCCENPTIIPNQKVVRMLVRAINEQSFVIECSSEGKRLFDSLQPSYDRDLRDKVARTLAKMAYHQMYKDADGKIVYDIVVKNISKYFVRYNGVCYCFFQLVRCGKCLLCESNKSNDLTTRCKAESQSQFEKHGCHPLFVTFTYSNRCMPMEVDDGTQKVLKRGIPSTDAYNRFVVDCMSKGMNRYQIQQTSEYKQMLYERSKGLTTTQDIRVMDNNLRHMFFDDIVRGYEDSNYRSANKGLYFTKKVKGQPNQKFKLQGVNPYEILSEAGKEEFLSIYTKMQKSNNKRSRFTMPYRRLVVAEYGSKTHHPHYHALYWMPVPYYAAYNDMMKNIEVEAYFSMLFAKCWRVGKDDVFNTQKGERLCHLNGNSTFLEEFRVDDDDIDFTYEGIMAVYPNSGKGTARYVSKYVSKQKERIKGFPLQSTKDGGIGSELAKKLFKQANEPCSFQKLEYINYEGELESDNLSRYQSNLLFPSSNKVLSQFNYKTKYTNAANVYVNYLGNLAFQYGENIPIKNEDGSYDIRDTNTIKVSIVSDNGNMEYVCVPDTEVAIKNVVPNCGKISMDVLLAVGAKRKVELPQLVGMELAEWQHYVQEVVAGYYMLQKEKKTELLKEYNRVISLYDSFESTYKLADVDFLYIQKPMKMLALSNFEDYKNIYPNPTEPYEFEGVKYATYIDYLKATIQDGVQYTDKGTILELRIARADLEYKLSQWITYELDSLIYDKFGFKLSYPWYATTPSEFIADYDKIFGILMRNQEVRSKVHERLENYKFYHAPKRQKNETEEEFSERLHKYAIGFILKFVGLGRCYHDIMENARKVHSYYYRSEEIAAIDKDTYNKYQSRMREANKKFMLMKHYKESRDYRFDSEKYAELEVALKQASEEFVKNRVLSFGYADIDMLVNKCHMSVMSLLQRYNCINIEDLKRTIAKLNERFNERAEYLSRNVSEVNDSYVSLKVRKMKEKMVQDEAKEVL